MRVALVTAGPGVPNAITGLATSFAIPHWVTGLVIALVDRLPTLLEHMENDVLPVLTRLDRVGPDLHELLAVVEDLRRVITGLPGVGLLRRRGDDEPPTD